MKNHPYINLPEKHFWQKSISNKHFFDLRELFNPVDIGNIKIGTAGSCFAQHVTRNIKERGFNFLDCEHKPSFISDEQATTFGYNMYSARYGNIYSSRQLLQLLLEAKGKRTPTDLIWKKDGRFYDSLRPAVMPGGLSSPSLVEKDRALHIAKVKQFFSEVQLFIFTLGLTECWIHNELDGTVFPTAPGVIAGEYNSSKYIFYNLNTANVVDDLENFWTELKEINPNVKMILTVSPVPLAATASNNHILVANTYSKSVLRAAASDFIMHKKDVTYFPSYEIINSHPSRSMFFDPDLRTVNKVGVNFVMKHFFNDDGISNSFTTDIMCDEDNI